MSTDQQRRTRCEAWCEERARAAAGAGASRQARGVILSTGQLQKSKGESVSGAEWRRAKRAGVQRRRTVSTVLHASKGPLRYALFQPVYRRPLRTLRAPSAHSHLLRDRLLWFLYSFGEAHAARGGAPLSVRKGRSGWFCQTCVGCYLGLFILCP